VAEWEMQLGPAAPICLDGGVVVVGRDGDAA
jgi:hypothetical protein